MRRKRLSFVFTCLLLAGCADDLDGYPPDLRFPPRTDPIVIQTPPRAPDGPTPAGKLDDAIATFPDQGGILFRPADLPPSDQAAFADAMTEVFGTPAAPALPGGDAAKLADGSRLYRRLCTQCHGTAGDGRGPAGPYNVPHPRDFRAGVFKCAAGPTNGTATLDAIRAVLRGGVPGTAMQAFDLIPDADLDALAHYVVYLSVRGETELRWLRAALDSEDAPAPATPDAVRSLGSAVFARWRAAEAASVPPVFAVPEDAEAVRRGHELFVGSAGCAACHVDFGRGIQFRYDLWGAVARVPDLTRGEYRWGRGAADHARKIRHGIPGSGMPASALPDDQVRDLAAFVSALPHPPRLPADLRSRIYP